MTYRPTSTATLFVLSIVFSLPAFSASTDDVPLEEIVVRGTLRDAALSETASSVSVVSIDSFDAGTRDHLEEVLNQAPNVNFSSGASRARFIQIRGIGERGQFAEPLNASVGIILDGVDISGIGTAATLLDIDQVEIFRGPQGTLYGANALAGLINITSNAPTSDFYSQVTLDAGDFNTHGLGAVVSGALTDAVSGRFAWRRYRDDGFVRNTFLDSSSTASHDEETWRAQLRWRPIVSADVSVSFGRVVVDNGYDNFSLDNNRTTLSDEPGRDAQTTTYGSLRWAQSLRSGRQLIASVGHAASDSDYGYDEDWAFDGFHPFGYTSTDHYQRDRNNSTIDIRLLSAPDGNSGTTDWVTGFFALQQSVDLNRDYTFLPQPFSSEYDIERIAIYGQVTQRFGNQTRLTMGLRAERHQAEYSDSDALTYSPGDSLIGGKLQLERDLSNGALIYAGITRGYKAGGFNTDGSLDSDLREFQPEVLWNAEVGVNQRWLNDRLHVRGSVFFMLRDDIQISTSIVRERPDGSSEFIDFTGNGAEGDNLGAEIEVAFDIDDRFAVFGSIGLLKTAFSNYTNGSGDNLDGRDQAQAPNYQFHLGTDFKSASGWFARLELEGRDEYYFSDSHDVQSDSYALIHSAVGYSGEQWSIKLWGRNLGDTKFPVRGFFFGNDPRDGYTARSFVQLGEPRRFGVSASFEW